MSDRSLIDDPLVSFDQGSSSSPKAKATDSYENRSLDDIDPFGNHNGQKKHHDDTNGNKTNDFNQFSLTNDLFPVDTPDNEKSLNISSTHTNEESEDALLNFQPHVNGSVTDNNALLLDLDPDAPPSSSNTNTTVITPSPNDTHSQQDNKMETLLDFGSSTDDTVKHGQESNLASFTNPFHNINPPNTNENVLLSSQSTENEEQLIDEACDDVNTAAQELAAKIDLVTTPSPPATSDRQPPPSFDIEQQPTVSTQSSVEDKKAATTLPTATSPTKKPAAGIVRPTSSTKTKPASATAASSSKSTEHKPAAASKTTESKPATTATKITEPKPSTTVRKPLHSAPVTSTAASSKPKTPTSPTQESSTASKPTRDVPAKPPSTTASSVKPKPVASSSTASTAAASRPTVKPVTKSTRPTTIPKTSDSTSPDQQTTILSTAPEGSPSSTTVPAASTTTKASARPPQPSTKPPVKAVASTTSGVSSHSTTASRASALPSKPAVIKERPRSQNRTTTRPSTATSASTTVAPKRSNSAHRPATADATTRPTRSSAADSASGTTVGGAKPQWNSASSKVGSLQNTTHKAGGGNVKKPTVSSLNPIPNQKLQWSAKSKVGSLENAHHKPGGGSVKIESKKLDFKDKAKPKTDSGIHETMASGGGGEASASATVNDEHETSDEVFESQKKDNGDK